MPREESNQEPKLREATLDDADSIHGLAAELAKTVGDAPPNKDEVRRKLEALLDEPRVRVIVAEGEAGLLGAASLWIKPDLAHGDTVVEVPMLVVAKEARRGGVGKLLMAKVQKVATENDANLIELVATRSNVAAQEFYRSLGFTEADVVSLEFVGNVENPPDPEKN